MYEVISANSQIHIGDTVKVVRKAKSNECGWNNTWVDQMTKMVGRKYKVLNVDHYDGIEIGKKMTFEFPCFCLEVVKRASKSKTIRAFNIKYDTEGKRVKLPNEIFFEVRLDFDEDAELADLITDRTGWCVYSCECEKVGSGAKTVEDLRKRGYCVVVFSPKELKVAEEIVSRSWQIIEGLRQ